MAGIEFIQKRIAGKEKEIEKLENKLARIHEVAGFVDRGIDDCAHFQNGLFGNGQRGRRHLMRDPGVHVVEVDFNPLRFVARNQLLDEIAHDVQQRQINDDADDLK